MNSLSRLSRTHRFGTTLGAAVLLVSLSACGSSDDGTVTPTVDETTEAPATSEPTASETATSEPSETASSEPGEGGDVTGSLSAEDQESDGMTLTVASVELEGIEGGWIAVHADQDGAPGPVIGTQQVEQGENTEVEVTLDEAVTTGAFWPMLHVDDNTIGTYEFPMVEGADLPVMADGEVVVTQIMLEVA